MLAKFILKLKDIIPTFRIFFNASCKTFAIYAKNIDPITLYTFDKKQNKGFRSRHEETQWFFHF